MDLSGAEIVAVLVATSAAFVLSASAGLGGSLILVPALSAILGPKPGIALAALSAYGFSLVVVYHNPVAWIPPGIPGRDAILEVDENVGGAANIALLIESKPGKTIKDRDVLVALEKLERHIAAYEDPTKDFQVVNNITSVLDVVRESWRATSVLPTPVGPENR